MVYKDWIKFSVLFARSEEPCLAGNSERDAVRQIRYCSLDDLVIHNALRRLEGDLDHRLGSGMKEVQRVGSIETH